jgi:hypothetical protein
MVILNNIQKIVGEEVECFSDSCKELQHFKDREIYHLFLLFNLIEDYGSRIKHLIICWFHPPQTHFTYIPCKRNCCASLSVWEVLFYKTFEVLTYSRIIVDKKRKNAIFRAAEQKNFERLEKCILIFITASYTAFTSFYILCYTPFKR